MKKISALLFIILILVYLSICGTAEAAVGDIVNWYWGRSPHWYGGLTIKYEGDEMYICENESATSYIWIMRPNAINPHELDTVDSVPLGIAKDAGIAWDNDQNVWWVSGANWYFGVGRLPEAGGNFNCDWITGHGVNPYGLDYYSPGRKLYIGSSVGENVIVYDVSTAACPPPFDRYIPVGITPIAVSRAGDYLWVSDANSPFGTYKFDLEGNWMGDYFILPEGRESLSLEFDGQYLWSRTNNNGNGIKIYQIDIGFIPPPTPSPEPEPTPAIPIIDSADYNGDGTSDIAIFRGSSGIWAIRGQTRLYFGTSGDVPAPGDFDGDGDTDIAIFRNSIGLWAARGVTRFYFGKNNDISVPGDYDGDGNCDAGIFRPDTGLWVVRNITRIYFGQEGDTPVPAYGNRAAKHIGIFRPSSGLWALRGLTRSYFGTGGDLPVPDNYQGNTGALDLGIYRPNSGFWAIKGISRLYFGASNDLPIPGYYRGTDTAEICIFRPATGLWAIRSQTRIYYGTDGDTPLGGRVPEYNYNNLILDSGDYNGDGTGDMAVFRPDNGLWAIKGVTRVYFGGRKNIPVPGDYNGDGTTDIAVYDLTKRLWSVKNVTRIYFSDTLSGSPVPGDYTGDNICDAALFQDGLWSIRIQFPEPYIFQIQYGKKGDLPVPGRYSGKNLKEIAIYRPSSGLWAINNLTRIYFGENGDIVVPADYNGNGTTDPAVYRSDEKLWAVRNITRVNFTGSGEMIPIPFDYQGDGTDNIARFNNTLGLWSIRSHTRIYFGAPGDLPVSGPDIQENKRENSDPAIPHFLQE